MFLFTIVILDFLCLFYRRRPRRLSTLHNFGLRHKFLRWTLEQLLSSDRQPLRTSGHNRTMFWHFGPVCDRWCPHLKLEHPHPRPICAMCLMPSSKFGDLSTSPSIFLWSYEVTQTHMLFILYTFGWFKAFWCSVFCVFCHLLYMYIVILHIPYEVANAYFIMQIESYSVHLTFD